MLARTAFQDDAASAKEHIALKDGEASFADLENGENEANYLGFNMDEEDGQVAYVYFYVESEDLATQMEATVMASGTEIVADVGVDQESDNETLNLRGGNVVAGTVTGATSTVETNLDAAYCAGNSMAVATTTGRSGSRIDDADDTQTDQGHTIYVPSDWGVTAAGDGTPTGCTEDERTALGDDIATSTTDDRTRLAGAELVRADAAEAAIVLGLNQVYYTYDGDAYTEVHPDHRYTRGNASGDMVGGDLRPLASVDVTLIDNAADTEDIEYFTNISNADNGEIQAFKLGAVTVLTQALRVDLTYDVQDVYAAEEDEDKPHDGYSSGFGRAYVRSGSDSGQWVPITEVKATTLNADGEASATSNLFQGVVKIVNDTSLETDSVIYAQDGDTLTLTVYDENGNRSSDVLASATALIDNSAPTISDLSPADDSVISDDTLQISFNVNDEGAGLDFRGVDEKLVVEKVEAQVIQEDKMGIRCVLTENDDDIDNAGGNASRVGVLISPSGDDAKFSARCGNVIEPDLGPDEDGGNGNTHGNKFNLIITSRDLAGNVDTHTTQLTIDTEDPTVKGNPSAGEAWDADENMAKSSANSILVQFNESLDVDTVSAADFTVAGYTIDSVEVVGTNEDDGDKNLNEYVVITLTEDLAKSARPSVSVSGVTDVAGNAIETATRTSDNKITAAITVVPFTALIAKDGEQAISFTSDEALRATSRDYNTQSSVNGNTTGLAIKVAADTMGGSGSFKQKTFDDSRAYGVMLRAVDVDGNKTDVGAVKVSDEDLKLDLENDLVGNNGDTVDVKLANWPPADSNLNGSFQGEVVAKVNNKEVASSTDTVHWDGDDAGKVQLLVGAGVTIKKDATLNLSYKYVNADQVIQVDVDPPTMESIPADNAETDYAAGVIQFVWSEAGEYAGDSYKTVTLNEASHEGPNGTSTDILDMLSTNDKKTWVLRPSADLALGDHEFTLKATDAAGNSKTESVTITVIERKPVEIGLSPGWNLISFRGQPASLDVNDIFSSDSVSVVSQYDGRRVSPWTVWTRGSDGSLSSSPAGRSTIDPGLGLYVLSTDGSPLEVDIPGVSRDAPAQIPPSIELIPGWNLIAVILIGDKESVDVDEYLPAGAWSRAFRLSKLTGALESFSPQQGEFIEADDDTSDDLNEHEGLWVFATKATTVVPK